MSRLKGDPAILRPVWAGFQAYLREVWEQQVGTIVQTFVGDIAAGVVKLCYPENIEELPFEIVEVATRLAAQDQDATNPEDRAAESSLPLVALQEAARHLFSSGIEKPSKRWQEFRIGVEESVGAVWAEFDNWFKAVQSAHVGADYGLPPHVNLAVRIAKWCDRRRSAQDLEGEPLRRAMLIVRATEDLIREVFPRYVPSVTRLKHIPATPEFGELLGQGRVLGLSFSELSDAHQAWRTQLEQVNVVYSEQDAVLGAWLGFHLAVLPVGSPRRIVGHEKEKLTHILIDEAQDLSPIHGMTLFRFLDKDGTVTAVGDLRQRVTRDRGLKKWTDLGISNMRQAAFQINFRQSLPLGTFIKKLHEKLFAESPSWNPSNRLGPKPRVSLAGENDDIAVLVAAEVRQIRSFIPRATVGIVYNDSDPALTPTVLEQLRENVEDQLQNDLVPARLVPQKDGVGQINQFDCAIVVSVMQTKGLEFDGVVILDASGKWTACDGQNADVTRNRLYVAASRAKQSLSIIAPKRVPILTDLLRSGTCELV